MGIVFCESVGINRVCEDGVVTERFSNRILRIDGIPSRGTSQYS